MILYLQFSTALGLLAAGRRDSWGMIGISVLPSIQLASQGSDRTG